MKITHYTPGSLLSLGSSGQQHFMLWSASCNRSTDTSSYSDDTRLMRTDQVEIFSDETNSAVIRHPNSRFPGVLIQGDTMSNYCRLADEACLAVKNGGDAFQVANELRNLLRDQLNHYKQVLGEHDIPLPNVIGDSRQRQLQDVPDIQSNPAS